MLVVVGIALWVLVAILVITLKRRLPYGGVSPSPKRAKSDEKISSVVEERNIEDTNGTDTSIEPLPVVTRWAPIDPLSDDSSSEDDDAKEKEEEAAEGEEEGKMEEKEEVEEACGEEEEEDWEDDDEEEEEKKPKETCKMQFVILNTGPRNTRLHSGALCDTIANLAVKNIVKIRELEGDMTMEDIKKDATRAEWIRAYRIWDSAGVTKITLRCDSREAFDDVVAKAATELSLPVTVKVFGPNTAIAAIGPSSSDTLTKVTGHLKLLS